MKIKVPASSSNLGCGFDSVGFAVNLHLELEITGPSDVWEITHQLGAEIPTDHTNLVIDTALKIAPELQPHRIRMTSDIPLERGLGSSSSALVAGIELACAIGGMNLSKQVKLQLACSMEGHPDNVAPAILGGMIVSAYCEGVLEYVKIDTPETGIVAYVPDYKLPTVAMRKVLPQEFPFKEAVWASSVGNVMVASLLKGDIAKAGRMMEQDKFHERYRSKLVPELMQLREIAHKHGAYATYLSGAGPVVVCLTPTHKTDEVAEAFSRNKTGGARILKLAIDPQGSWRG